MEQFARVRLDSWVVRISLGAEPPAPFALLLELLRQPPARQRLVPCVVLTTTGAQHFNAIDQLVHLLLDHNILAGILELPRSQKQLFVPVSANSTLGIISGEMERLASMAGIRIAMRLEQLADLTTNVPVMLDVLLKSALMYQLQTHGCMLFSKKNSTPQVLLTSSLCSGEMATVAVQRTKLTTDLMGLAFIEIECVPVRMLLKTLAASSGPEKEQAWGSSSRLVALPRMGECWLVSRHSSLPEPSPLQRWERGLDCNVLQSDEDFRNYWQNVHRICLPKDFGGYVRVRFSSRSLLTYPACCIASQWTISPRQSRGESLDVIRQFQFILQKMFSMEAVSVRSAHEQKPKSASFLPASGLVVREEAPNATDDTRRRKTRCHLTNGPRKETARSSGDKNFTKRRMLAKSMK